MIGNFLMDNVGNLTSIRNVASKFTSGTYKTNDKTVGSYIDYYCKSFLFYPVQRYDIKGKRYLESDSFKMIAVRLSCCGEMIKDIDKQIVVPWDDDANVRRRVG